MFFTFSIRLCVTLLNELYVLNCNYSCCSMILTSLTSSILQILEDFGLPLAYLTKLDFPRKITAQLMIFWIYFWCRLRCGFSFLTKSLGICLIIQHWSPYWSTSEFNWMMTWSQSHCLIGYILRCQKHLRPFVRSMQSCMMNLNLKKLLSKNASRIQNRLQSNRSSCRKLQIRLPIPNASFEISPGTPLNQWFQMPLPFVEQSLKYTFFVISSLASQKVLEVSHFPIITSHKRQSTNPVRSWSTNAAFKLCNSSRNDKVSHKRHRA